MMLNIQLLLTPVFVFLFVFVLLLVFVLRLAFLVFAGVGAQ